MIDALSVVDELRALPNVEGHPTLPPLDPAVGDKWIVRSALQKAIRRGSTDEAVRLGAALAAHDCAYLWHTLAVVMVEDIGIGWVDGWTYTTVCTLKTVRQKAIEGIPGGEARLMHALIGRMCNAAKHRGCCELSLAVEYGERRRLLDMDRWPTPQLVAALAGGDMATSYAALLVMKGLSRGLLRRPRDNDGLAQAEEIIVDRLRDQPAMARAAIHCLRRPCDSMSLAVMPVCVMAAEIGLDNLSVREERENWPSSEIISGFNAEAFDVHTRDGKMALRAFHTSVSKREPILTEIDPLRAVQAMGATVFIVEGSLVDRRIDGHPRLQALREAQDRAFMVGEGVPEARFEETKALVRSNIPLLHAKRRWVLGETRAA